jgi:hypothetical protein
MTMPRLVLLLALAALAGPRVALAQASGEGLLREVLSATESRQRTRDMPERRPLEDRALQLANAALAQPALATGMVIFRSVASHADTREACRGAAGANPGGGERPFHAFCSGGMALPNPPPMQLPDEGLPDRARLLGVPAAPGAMPGVFRPAAASRAPPIPA